jgi:hypothetical protein
LDKIKSLPEVYLDDASKGDTFPPILPKKLLHEINVMRHITTSKKSIMTMADNII